jgi:uncharacterized membrane protein
MGEIERRRWTSGNVTVLVFSAVFLVVTVAFVILGVLSLTIEAPNVVLGVTMLIGAGILGIASLIGIALTVRNLMRPPRQE